MLTLVRKLMRGLRNSGFDRRHMTEAALALRDVMSRKEILGGQQLNKSPIFLSFVYHRLILSTMSVGAMLVISPTSKRPASDVGRCSGQLLMMWSAVCTGSPHSHAALSASPNFFMDALYRRTPVRSLFRVVQCFWLRSSRLTPCPWSDTWRCTRVVPGASHSCFHVAAIHASSGMTLSIS